MESNSKQYGSSITWRFIISERRVDTFSKVTILPRVRHASSDPPCGVNTYTFLGLFESLIRLFGIDVMSFLSLIDHALILLTILLETNFMQIHNVHYVTTGVRGVTSEIYLTSNIMDPIDLY